MEGLFAVHHAVLSSLHQALGAFQRSGDVFRVLCTVPGRCPGRNTPVVVAAQPPSGPVRTLLVLDSSFNPPTVAHAAMVRSAVAAATAATAAVDSRVLLLLALNNADKAPRPAPFEHRLGMMFMFGQDLLQEMGGEQAGSRVDIAVTTEPYFHLKSAAIAESDFYADSSSSSSPPPEQVFLTGYDTAIRILDRKYYSNMALALGPFFARARVRVTARPGGEWGESVEAQREQLRRELERGAGADDEQWRERIELVRGDPAAEGVSSSAVRDALEGTHHARAEGMVGEGVGGWIGDMGLYRSRQPDDDG